MHRTQAKRWTQSKWLMYNEMAVYANVNSWFVWKATIIGIHRVITDLVNWYASDRALQSSEWPSSNEEIAFFRVVHPLNSNAMAMRLFSIGFLCQCLVECGMLTAASRSFHAKNVNPMLVYFKFFFPFEMSIMSFSLQSDSSFVDAYVAPILCCTLSPCLFSPNTNSSHYIRFCCACVCVFNILSPLQQRRFADYERLTMRTTSNNNDCYVMFMC